MQELEVAGRTLGSCFPLLTSKGTSLRLKGKHYAACVRSVMMYGSETWVIKKEGEWRCERNEMRMVRWMCDVKLKDRKPNVQLRDRLGIESIIG